MEWPSQSPDLNPIELVWDELDRMVKAKQPTSATHLRELLQQCWEELSEQYLISIEKEYHEFVRLLYLQKVATLMSQKFKLNFVQQNNSMNFFYLQLFVCSMLE